jgi:hypothetical protein
MSPTWAQQKVVLWVSIAKTFGYISAQIGKEIDGEKRGLNVKNMSEKGEIRNKVLQTVVDLLSEMNIIRKFLRLKNSTQIGLRL